MQPKRINASLSVSEQIRPEALAGIASAGFRSVICNRPDGEGADQPGFAEIEVAAQAAGLQAAYQPVVSGKVKDSDAPAFGTLLDSLPKPILAHFLSQFEAMRILVSATGAGATATTGLLERFHHR